MSVPEPFRRTSRAEFLNTFHAMRKRINILMMRDFGMKKRAYDVNLLADIYEISDDDKAALTAFSKKYGMSSYPIAKCPYWRITQWRVEVSQIMDNIGVSLELANNIRIDGDFFADAYMRRRSYMEAAQGYCHALKDKFHEILDILDTNIGDFEEISKMLKKEINYIKAVKRADKKVYMKNKEEFGSQDDPSEIKALHHDDDLEESN